MKIRVTRYPNNETRIALYPERFPKSFEALCQEPLDSSSGSDSPPDRAFNIKSKVDTVPRKRRMALSRNGRRQVLRAGACFDSTETTRRLLLTGTLPGTGNQAFRTLAEYSSYASKTLTNWLNRRSPGCPWMYTWEFQGRGALHIHLVVEVPLPMSGYIEAHFKDEWNRILRKICNLSGRNLYAKTAKYSHSEDKTQADVTICDREPSRYISKYITKSSTHAKAFGRFPPKTWYQVSRSLLKRLRDSTSVYEWEGLSYRQSLKFIEDASHRLSQYVLSGSRRFMGSILAWSGYLYSEEFNIEEFGGNFAMKERQLLSIETMVKKAMTVSQNYPAARCYMRSVNANEIESAIANGTATLTQMKTLIATIMESLTTIWDRMHNRTQAALFLKCSIEWWDAKYGHVGYTESYRDEINTICNNFLTR